MPTVSRCATTLLFVLPLAVGCQSGMPRWDWWRSASNGPPAGATVAANNAPKYPQLPSATASPASTTSASTTASTGTTNPFPPGTSAPGVASAYPTTTPASYTATPGSYPSTSVTGSYPTTAGNYAPQTTPYDAGAYGAYGGTPAAAAHVAANPAATGGYPSTGYPTANPTAAPSYPMPGAAAAGAGAAAPDASGYATGSRYDGAADRYSYPSADATPASTTGGYPPAPGAYPPAQNNHGAPNTGAYPATTVPPAGYGADSYRGSDAGSGSANYAGAATTPTSNDRYSNYAASAPTGDATAGPVATTADARSAYPTATPRYDSNVTPASGGTYLPAGTKLLEGEMPTSPSAPAPAPVNAPTDSGSVRPGSLG